MSMSYNINSDGNINVNIHDVISYVCIQKDMHAISFIATFSPDWKQRDVGDLEKHRMSHLDFVKAAHIKHRMLLKALEREPDMFIPSLQDWMEKFIETVGLRPREYFYGFKHPVNTGAAQKFLAEHKF